MSRAELKPNSRRSPLTRRTPSRRCPLSATAVTAQLRSTASACASESSAIDFGVAQNVPMLENIQYQNQMIKPVPPQAATYRRISHTQSMLDLLDLPNFQTAHGSRHQLGQHLVAGVEIAHGGQHAVDAEEEERRAVERIHFGM